MDKQTKTVHTQQMNPDSYGALNMPVYNSAAYGFPTAKSMADAFVGRTNAPTYSRVTNPTVTFFEERVKDLSGAQNVFAFNSGMAAICCTIMALAASGKNIVTSAHLFGNTVSLLKNTLGRFGVETRFVDLLDSCWKDYEDATQYRSAVDEHADCIVTRNKKDFKHSAIEVLTPAEFFDKLIRSNPQKKSFSPQKIQTCAAISRTLQICLHKTLKT